MDRAQPVGLAIVGSHFRQKLVVRHAGRSDKPQLVADAAPYGPGHVDGQRQTGFVFGHVQKSLVQRERLDQIGVLMENAVNLLAAATTPRPSARPTTSGRPRYSGWSRCSTEA